jgi:flagellum-specific ATP synthase
MPSVVSPEHFARMQLFRRIYSRYQQNRDLISVGAYVPGSDKDIDFAVERMPHLRQFMQQGLKERVTFDEALQRLNRIVVPPARPGAPGSNAAPNNVTSLQSRTLSHGNPAAGGRA